MSLSISAAASEGQQSPLTLPALTADAPSDGASDSASSSNSSVADTVSIGNVLLDRLATYESDGSVLHQYLDPTEQVSASGSASASAVTHANGGIPARRVDVPELEGEGASGDGSTTALVNYQSVTSQETANLGSGGTGSQAGIVALQYEGLAVTDTEGSAGVSLDSNLSGVKAQSSVGDFTLQLAKALQADTTVDPTTGVRSLTDDGKAALIKTVSQLLLSKNFTTDEAATGAQALADSIDGTSKSITLSLQHRGDQTDSWLHQSQASGADPDANSYSQDYETADDINISLDTGTGELGVDLHEHTADTEESVSIEHGDDVNQVLARTAPASFFGAGGQDIQNATGVLQESSTSSRFTSNQSTLSVALDDGSASVEVNSTLISGRLRTQDVGEAAALGQTGQATLNDLSSTVAGLFDAVDTPEARAAASAVNPTTTTATADKTKTAPSLTDKTATTGLHPRISPFITALTNVLTLLQSVKPAPAETSATASKAASRDKGKLQSVSTSQEALNVTATSSKYEDGEAITENNAFLAALYSKPSAAKPSTKLSV